MIKEKIEICKIVDQWQVRNYTVLTLDKDLWHANPYNVFIIDGKKYEPVPIYDMPKCIAIKKDTDCSFIGKSVTFSLENKKEK